MQPGNIVFAKPHSYRASDPNPAQRPRRRSAIHVIIPIIIICSSGQPFLPVQLKIKPYFLVVLLALLQIDIVNPEPLQICDPNFDHHWHIHPTQYHDPSCSRATWACAEKLSGQLSLIVQGDVMVWGPRTAFGGM